MAQLLTSVVERFPYLNFTDDYTANCSEKGYTPHSNEGVKFTLSQDTITA